MNDDIKKLTFKEYGDKYYPIFTPDKKTEFRLSKEEAVEFAKKYMKDRNDYTSCEKSKRAWNIATEYILLDIIPFLYGDALD